MATPVYVIESRSDLDYNEEHTGQYNTWSTDGIGTHNEFASREEAEAGIEHLRKLGYEWAEAEYRVVEVEPPTVGCAYCYADVPGTEDDPVPALDDDEAWEELAPYHTATCEWVVTRAHRRVDN